MFVGVQVPPRVPVAGIAQLVEHDLAKVGVASSSLVSRSEFERKLKGFLFLFQSVRFIGIQSCFQDIKMYFNSYRFITLLIYNEIIRFNSDVGLSSTKGF